MANLAVKTLINILKVQETWFNKSFIGLEKTVNSLITKAMTGKLSYRESRRILQNIYYDHPNAFSGEDVNKYIREFTSSYLRAGYARTSVNNAPPKIRPYSGSDIDIDLLVSDGVGYLLNTFGSGSISTLIDDINKPWEYSGVSGCYSALLNIAKRHYPLGLSLLTEPSARIDPLQRTPSVDLFYRNVDEMYSILDRIESLPEIANTTCINYDDINVLPYSGDEFDEYNTISTSQVIQAAIKRVLCPKAAASNDNGGFDRFDVSLSRLKTASETLGDMAKGTRGCISALLDSYSRLLGNDLIKIPSGVSLTEFMPMANKLSRLSFAPGFLIKTKANAEAMGLIYKAIDEAMTLPPAERRSIHYMDLVYKVLDKIELYADDSTWVYGEARFKEISTDPIINTVLRVESTAYWRGVVTTNQIPLSDFVMLSDEYIDITPEGYITFKFDNCKGIRIDSDYYGLLSDMILALAGNIKIKPPKHKDAVAVADLPLFIRPNKTIEENLIALGFTLTKKEINNDSANKPAKAGRRNRKD
ncbi:hypothetical protein [Proteus columbae]|uniref:hypothetical protein n=1 Tax=Proteus columbae TaxID=1987580 RepID=UPI00288BA578|nr:hypothetical protein [Proteus columbae]